MHDLRMPPLQVASAVCASKRCRIAAKWQAAGHLDTYQTSTSEWQQSPELMLYMRGDALQRWTMARASQAGVWPLELQVELLRLSRQRACQTYQLVLPEVLIL